jgi:4'-phosphopantetheinyl transferase
MSSGVRCDVFRARADATPSDSLSQVQIDDRLVEKADALAPGVDRAAYLLSHRLLRIAVATVLDIDVPAVTFDRACPQCGSREHGKLMPSGDAGRSRVSLSRSGPWCIAVVITSGPLVAAPLVGVDVERVPSLVSPRLCALALTEREMAAIAALEVADRPARFTDCWVRKEAYAKATGRGLTLPFRTLDPNTAGPGVHLRELDVAPGYRGCIAVLARRTVEFVFH